MKRKEICKNWFFGTVPRHISHVPVVRFSLNLQNSKRAIFKKFLCVGAEISHETLEGNIGQSVWYQGIFHDVPVVRFS